MFARSVIVVMSPGSSPSARLSTIGVPNGVVYASTMTQTIVQPGRVGGDLIVYAHIAPSLIARDVPASTLDTFVVELCGEGTSAYRGMIGAGWEAYVAKIAARVGHGFERTVLITWSAGSQVAKEVAMSERAPDAIVMLDGLYANKPAGARPGDGLVSPDAGLLALVRYGTRAARGEGPTLVILHSAILTPYASSSECAAFLRAEIEGVVGVPFVAIARPSALAAHPPHAGAQYGQCVILSFDGANGAEHVAEAHLWDEVCALWVPFVSREPVEASAVTPTTPATPLSTATFADLAVSYTRADLDAHVAELPPRSNGGAEIRKRFAGTMLRRPDGTNPRTGLTSGPWCAAELGYIDFRAACTLLGILPPDPLPPSYPVADIMRQAGCPVLWRAAVHELVEDARVSDAWRLRGAAVYVPEPGDAAVFMRDGSSPLRGGTGHVGRVVRAPDADGRYATIDGNHGDRVALVERRMDDPDLCGFIAYPRDRGAIDDVPTWMIDDVKAKVAASLDGMMREQNWSVAP